MDIYTLDFETYYAKGYSLSGMSTEEYVRDPKFEALLVGIKKNREPTIMVPGQKIAAAMDALRPELAKSAILCHHAHFDGFILAHHYDVKPKAWFDTLSMARAIHGGEVGNGLAKLAEHYGIGQKGAEVHNAMGKRLADFTREELKRYADYCANDVNLTFDLFNLMLPKFRNSELRTIDSLIRMFTEPMLEIDSPLADLWVDEIRANKARLVMECGVTKDELMSNDKFAAALQSVLDEHGQSVPTKISLTTNKQTWAFAKSDEAFTALLEHEDDRVQALVAARLGNKSTINETRGMKFANIGRRGTAPIYIKYAGAHQTQRTSGGDGVNWQNLGKTKSPKDRDTGRLVMTPAGWCPLDGVTDIEGSKDVNYHTPLGMFNSGVSDVHLVGLRDTVHAPPGHALVVVDSSNIEARVLATLAGQADAVERFRNKVDPYCHMASHIYHRPVAKSDKAERQLGKIAVLGLGYGMGAQKFQDTVSAWGAGDIDILMAKATVDAYRTTYDMVPKLWRRAEESLQFVADGSYNYQVDPGGLLYTEKDRIVLPNGLGVRFPMLKRTTDGWVFWNGMQAGKAGSKTPVMVKIYGGKVVENLVQAIARIIVTEQMNEVARRYPVKWFIHDEIVLVVPEAEAEEALQFATAVMQKSPEWWPQVPLDAEGGHGYTYGNVK